jgi:hypothetical protein
MYKSTNPLIPNHARNTPNHGVVQLYWSVQLKDESAKGNVTINKVTFTEIVSIRVLKGSYNHLEKISKSKFARKYDQPKDHVSA